MKQIIVTINSKLKIKACLFMRGATTPSTPGFNTLPTLIKYSKLLFNSKNYIKIFREIRVKLYVEMNSLDRLWTALYIGYKFLSTV